MPSTLARVVLALALVPACVSSPADGDVEDGQNDNLGPKADGFADGSAQARAILALVNDAATDEHLLDIDVGLSSRAAHNIIEGRGMGYATIAALDAVAYVGPATLDALLDYAEDHNYGMGGGGGTDATLSTAWSIHSVGGGAAGCPAGYDTVALRSQRLGMNGEPSGTPAVDLYDCGVGMGAATLAPGRYKTWIDITSHDGMMVYGSSNSATIDVGTSNQNVSFDILTDGGYFSVGWTLRGATSGQTLACSAAGGVAGIELSSTLAGTMQLTTDIWDCDDHFGLTSGLAAGSYTVSLAAIDMSNAALGIAPAITRSIETHNKTTHLGDVEIPIDGR